MTGQRPSLMVVDDEAGILDVVSRFARRAGFDVVACSGGREAIGKLQTRSADLVMVDLRMPDVGGLDVLRAIRETDPHCQTVLMTGYATVETAVEAIKLGAMDYLSKPIDFGRLEQLLSGVREEIDRRRNLLTMESDVARRLEFCGMIGRGPSMQELFGLIRRLARESAHLPLTEALAAERAAQRKAGETADFRAAVLAFLQKRRPTFDGR